MANRQSHTRSQVHSPQAFLTSSARGWGFYRNAPLVSPGPQEPPPQVSQAFAPQGVKRSLGTRCCRLPSSAPRREKRDNPGTGLVAMHTGPHSFYQQGPGCPRGRAGSAALCPRIALRLCRCVNSGPTPGGPRLQGAHPLSWLSGPRPRPALLTAAASLGLHARLQEHSPEEVSARLSRAGSPGPSVNQRTSKPGPVTASGGQGSPSRR